jgi:putative nucleotidyltransferase with HDIG domain
MIRRQEIATALGEVLPLIQNAALREKVLDCFLLAIEEGRWTSLKDLEEMPFTLLTGTRGVSFLEHTLAVTKGAIGLARGQMEAYRQMPYPIDMDRLVAGGILHDVGKLLEIERRPDGTYAKSRRGEYARHPISGAILAAKVGLPDDIVNTIACHAREGEGAPKVVETVLIHQADFATFDPLVMLGKGTLIV